MFKATIGLKRAARLSWAIIAISLIVTSPCAIADAQRPAVAHKAAIASAYPLASKAGEEILKEGGNAFDAAVAVAAALAVVEPTSSGLGGGGFFLLHRQSDGFETMIDAREKAPGAASRDMYLDKAGNPTRGSTEGPLSAAIPGEPAAFEYLARKYGKLSLKQNLQPAIRLARAGFPLYERLQYAIKVKRDVLARSPDAAKAFLTPDGNVPEVGAILKQENLANTLEAIANQGAKGFYEGKVAAGLVAGVRAGGGIWTLADLKAYNVVERKPLIGEYHGARIVTAPPPSSGGIAILDSLNILSGFDLHGVDSATRKHLIVEAMRRAYRDRAIFLGDPDFIKKMPLQQLMSVDYAAGQRSSIRADKAMPSDLLPGIESEPKGMNTTHFSVLDAAGNRAAVTITVNLFFGNGYMPAGTGVLLNNEMDDFSIKPGTPNTFGLVGNTANSIAPNKRSLSSMSPTFVETPKGLMVIGSPGGSTIISQVLLGVLNYVDGMSAADIVKYPRYHHQYLPDEIMYEPGALSDGEIEKLQAMGHKLRLSGRRWGNMQVITWDFAGGKVEAASDPRGEGEGLVY